MYKPNEQSQQIIVGNTEDIMVSRNLLYGIPKDEMMNGTIYEAWSCAWLSWTYVYVCG